MMTAGMLIRRGRIVWGSQVRAGASARASSWEKASRPAGQGHDQAPDTVLVEPLQGKAVKPGVLEAQLGSLLDDGLACLHSGGYALPGEL